jgi:Ca2+-binding EF-hand superfamily protein
MFPCGNPKKFCNLIFELIDLDKNRTIDFTELLIALSFISEKDLNQKLRIIFQLIDQNKDGIITKKELRRVINSVDELIDKSFNQKNQQNFKVNTFFQLADLFDTTEMNEEQFVKANLKDPFIINFEIITNKNFKFRPNKKVY